MAMTPPGQSQKRVFDDILDRFEEAWNGQPAPRLAKFWASVPELPGRRQLLVELIKIDLHHRCAQGAERRGPLPALEEYAASFAELGGLERLPADLIAEEYAARRAAGARPTHAEYLQRFPAQASALHPLLAGHDQEMATETSPARRPDLGETRADDVGACLDILRDLGLLHGPQLAPEFRRQFADRQALVRYLARGRLLTAYQLEQLALGRPHALAVGPYLLLERIGEGATSVVFRARHRQLQRQVALKVIRKEVVRDIGPEVIARIYREFRAVGRLDHPNFVHAYDAGPVGSTLFIAMEYLQGDNLLQLVKREGPLPVPRALDYVRQACAALQHASSNGIVHRDVKPSNLIVIEHPVGTPGAETALYPWGRVKLLDLGMARLHHLSHSHQSGMLTHKGSVMGTADYMSPEQALDAHAVDIRADLYSLGCTLFFLLTGRPPFVGGSFVQKIERHRSEAPVPVGQLRPDVPGEVAAIVARLLAKDPAERYSSPADLYRALGGDPLQMPVASPGRELAAPTVEMEGSTLALEMPRPAEKPVGPRSKPRRSWRVPALVGGSLVLLIAALRFLLGGGSPPPEQPARPAMVGREVSEKVLAIECGRKSGQVVLQAPQFDCKLVQGSLWDQWRVLPPAKSYCWFHTNELIFEITLPPRTTGLLRLHFFDGDSNARRQRLFVQGESVGEYANFNDDERVVDVPLTADATASGRVEVRIEKLEASNAVVSTIELFTRKLVRVPRRAAGF